MTLSLSPSLFNWMESCPWIDWYVNRIVCMTRFKDRLFFEFTRLCEHMCRSHLAHFVTYNKKNAGRTLVPVLRAKLWRQKSKTGSFRNRMPPKRRGYGCWGNFGRIVFWFSKCVCTRTYLHMYTHIKIRILEHTYWHYTHEQYSASFPTSSIRTARTLADTSGKCTAAHCNTLRHFRRPCPPITFGRQLLG